MKFFRPALCLLLCAVLMLPAAAQSAPSEQTRFFVLSKNVPAGDLAQTIQLAASEFAVKGFDFPVVYGTETEIRSGDIVLEYGGTNAEGFSICAGEPLRIRYTDCNGLLYGMRTLLKMYLSGNVFSMTDAPDTAERTLMLDCARKYFSKEFICNLIRQMSWMGMNALELHLTEEQGIRADIWDEAYFTSENDYSWICGSKTAYWVYDCPDPDEGRYLTAAELVEIIEVAKKYHVEIIPSFNTPGHSQYLCDTYAAYVAENPDYAYRFNGECYQAASIASNQYSAVDIGSSAARAFVHSVMLDYAKFFAAYGCTKCNICADEISLDHAWAVGNLTAYDVFVQYLNETAAYLQEMGYTVRAFNDFLCYADANVALNEDIEIVYWHTPYPSAAADAEDFIEDGRTVYNAVQNYSYYALRVFNTPGYSDRPSWGLDARDENNIWWAFSRATAPRVYEEWNPSHLYEYTDSKKTVLRNGQLGGSYFLIWCDYAGLATEEEIWSGDYPLLERLWAHSAKSWRWESGESYEEFAAKIEAYYEYPGFTACTQASQQMPAVRINHARMLTIGDIQSLRQRAPQPCQAAYREFLRTGELSYGVFGRKMS